MSANLDKSLDDLVGSRRQSRPRNGRRASAKPSAGGVKKSAKAPKASPKAVHPTPAAPAASSKIIVSGLVSTQETCRIIRIMLLTYPSLAMFLRPISRYVDPEALAFAVIAIIFAFSNFERCNPDACSDLPSIPSRENGTQCQA